MVGPNKARSRFLASANMMTACREVLPLKFLGSNREERPRGRGGGVAGMSKSRRPHIRRDGKHEPFRAGTAKLTRVPCDSCERVIKHGHSSSPKPPNRGLNLGYPARTRRGKSRELSPKPATSIHALIHAGPARRSFIESPTGRCHVGPGGGVRPAKKSGDAARRGAATRAVPSNRV